DDGLYLGDGVARLLVAAELQELVLKPRERVVAAHRGRQPFPFDPSIRCSERGAIRSRRMVPEPELQKDVRRHVQRVARFWRDFRVPARRRERAPRVLWIVAVVEQVMQRARVRRVRLEYLTKDRGALFLNLAARQPFDA